MLQQKRIASAVLRTCNTTLTAGSEPVLSEEATHGAVHTICQGASGFCRFQSETPPLTPGGGRLGRCGPPVVLRAAVRPPSIAAPSPRQAETLKVEHDKLHAEMTRPDRIMNVCEVCGIFMQSTDAEAKKVGAPRATLHTALLSPSLSNQSQHLDA